ncbi:MAG: putative spermidine/putrescine transport system ATP-binding protein, partial [Solirubrobacteraceae bacterium]|nr:putative spermidine/putrescine transport system ATP-binding protein [Solirubrobacteraceae bacterium]
YDGGEDVTVVVRPERVELLPPGAEAGLEANALRGRVEEVIYLGNTRRYVVGLQPGGRRMLAREQVGGPSRGFTAGDDVQVTWPVDAGVLIARGPDRR